MQGAQNRQHQQSKILSFSSGRTRRTFLLSIVMAAPDYKARLKDAASLLDYGFARCSLYIDEQPDPLPEITVQKGISSKVSLKYADTFRYVSTDGEK